MPSLLHGSAGTVIVVAALAGTAAGCGGARPMSEAGQAKPASAVMRAARPYQLYTHCGIDEARIGRRYFAAVHPLSDGNGNPPPGWGNPFQKGTMTLVSPALAVFRDRAGHGVRFRLRPGATRFRHLCA